jgi:hypothetical protein
MLDITNLKVMPTIDEPAFVDTRAPVVTSKRARVHQWTRRYLPRIIWRCSNSAQQGLGVQLVKLPKTKRIKPLFRATSISADF